jgi:hypothetical protein
MSDKSVIVALATPELIKIPTPQQKLTSGAKGKALALVSLDNWRLGQGE